MMVDERFNRRSAPQVECRASTSMNLMASPHYEEQRVTVILRPEADGREEDHLHLRMDREEALRLGVELVRYGAAALEGETPSDRAVFDAAVRLVACRQEQVRRKAKEDHERRR
jgi:hypothetical protein